MCKKIRSFFCFPSNSNKREKPCPGSGPGLDLDSLSLGPLGVEVTGGKMFVLIPQNSKITKNETTLHTKYDNQSGMKLDVYEGTSSLVMENVRLAKFQLDGFPPAPKGVAKIKVCFDMDANGTLKVFAVDTASSDLRNEITITSEQRLYAKMLDAKKKLNKFARDIKHTLNDPRYEGKLEAPNIMKFMKAAIVVLEGLNMNQSAKVDDYKSMQKELEELWNPIVIELYKDAALEKVKLESHSPALENVKPGSNSPAPEKMKPESHNHGHLKASSGLDDVD